MTQREYFGDKSKKKERGNWKWSGEFAFEKVAFFLKVGFFEFLGLGLKALPDWLKISLQKLLGSMKRGLKAVKSQKRYNPTHSVLRSSQWEHYPSNCLVCSCCTQHLKYDGFIRDDYYWLILIVMLICLCRGFYLHWKCAFAGASGNRLPAPGKDSRCIPYRL